MQSIDSGYIKVTLVSGLSGRTETQRRTIKSLGLTKFGSSNVLPNVNPILGQVNKVIQFVKVEPSSAPRSEKNETGRTRKK